MRLLWSIPVTLAAMAAGGQAMAQIAPGMRVPETQLRAIGQALDMGCFLAVSGRPVPGINQPLLGIEGEGLKPQGNVPDWFSSQIATSGNIQASLLETPQGAVWVVFNFDTRECSVGAKAADRTALRDGLTARLTDAVGKWAISETSWERATLTKSIEGSPMLWSTVIVAPEAPADVILITMSATGQVNK